MSSNQPASFDIQDNLFPGRVSSTDVSRVISELEQRFESYEFIVLIDRYFKNAPALTSPYLLCEAAKIDHLSQYDMQNVIFIYACDSDEIGLPYIEEIVRKNGKFHPVRRLKPPASYVQNNDIARKVIEQEFIRQKEEGFAKFGCGPGDAVNITQAIDITSRIEGDYVEVGCFRGSSACIAVRYLNEIKQGRRCYFLDVFEGFNYDVAQQSPDIRWIGTHVVSEGAAVVEERISTFANPEIGLSVKVIESNIIEDELPSEIDKISVANIDVDQYEAVYAALSKVAPKIVSGGIIIVEDPGHTPLLIGARLALDHFSKSEVAKTFTSIYLESGQTFLLKR